MDLDNTRNLLKVVHINTSLSGGAGKAMLRLHEGLIKLGVDSFILTAASNNYSNSLGIYQLTSNDNLIKVSQFSLIEKIEHSIKIRVQKYFKITFHKEEKQLKEEFENKHASLDCEIASLPFSNYDILEHPILKDADIIHLHWVSHILNYPSFFKKNQKPIIWTLHDMNPFLGLFHYEGDARLNKKIIDNLDKKIHSLKGKCISRISNKMIIISPSKWLLKCSQSNKVFKKIKSHVIPNAINTQQNILFNANTFRLKNNIPTSNIILLFVANNIQVHRKGFDLIFQALQLANMTSVTLLVLGLNNWDDKECKLDIRLLGNESDNLKLIEYYSVADAVVLPSREDNLPNVMLESFSCGTPVIGFPVGGIKEHVEDFYTGVLAEDVSSKSLANSIDLFISNMHLFNREKIKKYAIDNFDERKIASRHIEVYNEVLLLK